MTFFLRPARTTDAGKLGQMMTDAIAAKPWKPRLHTGAEDIAFVGRMIDRGWVTVAEHIDLPTLHGFLARENDYIHALFIAPDKRNSGVGRALIEDAQSKADSLNLWTFEANTGAQRFYLREGFKETARTDGHDNDEGLPDVQFVWQRQAPKPKLADQDANPATDPAAEKAKP
jgi:GNAT superfamily N-acetyltransferase